jgi:hypothetical protein
MSRIILARSYFESGEYIKSIETIEEAHLTTATEQSIVEYSSNIYMQALSMKGI